jgi:hypothetical protein
MLSLNHADETNLIKEFKDCIKYIELSHKATLKIEPYFLQKFDKIPEFKEIRNIISNLKMMYPIVFRLNTYAFGFSGNYIETQYYLFQNKLIEVIERFLKKHNITIARYNLEIIKQGQPRLLKIPNIVRSILKEGTKSFSFRETIQSNPKQINNQNVYEKTVNLTLTYGKNYYFETLLYLTRKSIKTEKSFQQIINAENNLYLVAIKELIETRWYERNVPKFTKKNIQIYLDKSKLDACCRREANRSNEWVFFISIDFPAKQRLTQVIIHESSHSFDDLHHRSKKEIYHIINTIRAEAVSILSEYALDPENATNRRIFYGESQPFSEEFKHEIFEKINEDTFRHWSKIAIKARNKHHSKKFRKGHQTAHFMILQLLIDGTGLEEDLFKFQFNKINYYLTRNKEKIVNYFSIIKNTTQKQFFELYFKKISNPIYAEDIINLIKNMGASPRMSIGEKIRKAPVIIKNNKLIRGITNASKSIFFH